MFLCFYLLNIWRLFFCFGFFHRHFTHFLLLFYFHMCFHHFLLFMLYATFYHVLALLNRRLLLRPYSPHICLHKIRLIKNSLTWLTYLGLCRIASTYLEQFSPLAGFGRNRQLQSSIKIIQRISSANYSQPFL